MKTIYRNNLSLHNHVYNFWLNSLYFLAVYTLNSFDGHNFSKAVHNIPCFSIRMSDQRMSDQYIFLDMDIGTSQIC